MSLHSYSWSSSEPQSMGYVEREIERERKAKCGFPRKCLCGAFQVLRTCKPNDNLRENVGRKYYMCKGGGCTMLKWWDDAVMEEVHELKAEKSELEDRLRYMNTYSRGETVDPQRMWINVVNTRDDVNRLHLLSLAAEDNYEKIKSKVEEIVKQDLRIEVQKSVAVVKEMKMLTVFSVSMALVALSILLFK